MTRTPESGEGGERAAVAEQSSRGKNARAEWWVEGKGGGVVVG